MYVAEEILHKNLFFLVFIVNERASLNYQLNVRLNMSLFNIL